MRSWLPALSGMFCLGLGAGLIGIFGFFVPELAREFQVGVATLNIAPVALLLVPGIVAPFVGRLVDRVPIRRLILTGATFAMLSLLVASRAPNLVVAGLAFLGFSFGLTLYGPVVVNGMLVKLYPGREARALAIAAIGISLASAILPPLVGLMLEQMNWRLTLGSLVGGLLLLLWLVVLVGIPADAGVGGAGSGPAARPGREFYRQGIFWLVGVGVATGFSASLILAICYPPHFVSRGYSLGEAGYLLALAGLAGLSGKATLAALGDAARDRAKWVAAGLLLLQVAGLALLVRAQDGPAVYAAMFMAGFGGGAFLPMHAYLNSRYFPPEVIGQVTGAQMPLFLPFGLVGPPLAGYIFDRTGAYDLVLWGVAVILALGALLLLALPVSRGGGPGRSY